MLIKLTAEEWIAGAVVNGPIATRQADGNDYVVTVPKGAEFMIYQLSGDADGSIVVTGAGDGHAWRYGAGKGNSVRCGAGNGNARRGGAGYGDAMRDGDGSGHARRIGSTGHAYVRGVKQ